MKGTISRKQETHGELRTQTSVEAICLSELCHRAASYLKGQSNSPNVNVLQPVMRYGLFWEERVIILLLSPTLQNTHTHTFSLPCTDAFLVVCISFTIPVLNN